MSNAENPTRRQATIINGGITTMEISLPRLYLLRAMYAFIAIGFGLAMLPGILGPHEP